MNLVDELHAIADALERAAIPYAVCGGVAVTIHGATRTTKDIDLLVAASDIPTILEAIRPLGYEFVALPMTFDVGTDRERRVQRVSKIDGDHHLIVDLLHERGPLAGMLADRIEVNVPRGTLRVVSRESLIAMKRLAARPQDLADLERLEQPDASDGK